jgi:hypothetical protein
MVGIRSNSVWIVSALTAVCWYIGNFIFW